MGATNSLALDFSVKQARAFRLLETSPTVTQLLYGGAAGGGKSWLGCNWQIYRRLAYPGTRGAIGRDELKKIKRTTLKTLLDCWNEFWRYSGVSMKFNEQNGSIVFSNGSLS